MRLLYSFAGTRSGDKVAPIAVVRRPGGSDGAGQSFADAALIVPTDNLWWPGPITV
jgi:hypothetical protein